MAVHRFDPVDRGAGHKHRFTAHCSCEWWGVHRKTKRAARKVWADHLGAEQHATHRRRLPQPRTLTAADRLPAELR